MKELVCGTSRIVGCRFSILPMSDRFVEIIMGALDSVHKDKVWMSTDDVSTCIRGRAEHVFDVTRAMYAFAASSGVHTVFNGTYSIGCPGDTEADVYMSEDANRLNSSIGEQAHIQTACQFSLYPLGTENYMDVIYREVDRAKESGTFAGSVHYASRLDGSLVDVFASLEAAFLHAIQSDHSHLVMTATVSAHSPSVKQR
ncbi:HMP/thiamine ABC transporter substrate-binding protein ThiU [Paenibacillus sp. JCM 10914]|uniref:YkoF family thiamine/hydroxymethylpyrimidine-binding protein n=1 Tax=Paenibacillus sp. JCM 10914 TaxID=1236974 RepID=UPI0003CC64E2|nr:YkoF family thiamine/hydroxymethylpyrimidine-binding protein [Paenibacillus sp. JCM 10914]GAE08520.1 additional substrate-binding component of thiamin-regulated ECF transporter for HydroxyMethylPyrimidine [Paenibacillus sp. JCM 10914]